MRRAYVKELMENDRLQESISGSGCPGVLFLLNLHIYGVVLKMDGTGCFYTPAACLLSKTEIAARASESS